MSDNFGSATFGTWADLIRGGMTGEDGWFMGRTGHVGKPTPGQAIRSLLSPFAPSEVAVRQFLVALFGSRFGGDGFIRINDGVHGAVFAPAGAGKTTKMLGPNLLSYPGNVVCVDPKGGELYELTSEHRRTEFGHEIIRLDPALLFGPGANVFNPLDFIDPRACDFVDMSRDLANALMVRTGTEHEPFWGDSAETAIAAFIAQVCAVEPNKELRNLRNVRTLIASRQNYAFAVEAMQNNEDFHGVLQQLGCQLAWHVDRQLAGVMGHAQRHTDIFDSPLITNATCGTDWNPAELRSGRMTVYVIVPCDKLVVWSGWTRMVLGSLLRIITRGRPTERNSVTFFVDEAAHIGSRMQALEDGITLMRGMGIRMWLFFQSIDQLNRCFGDHASTVLDNLGTQLYFGINSDDTCEAVSKRIGDYTLGNVTYGSNTGRTLSTGIKSDGGSRNTGSNVSTTEMAVRLLKPDEIRRLDGSVGLLFHRNNPVMLVQMIDYFSDRAFCWRWWRGYGTGRSRGLGLGGMVLALIALAVSGLVTVLAAGLPVPDQHRPHAAAPGEFYHDGPVEPWRRPAFQPSPYGPGQRQPGGRPLPYGRQRRSYSY